MTAARDTRAPVELTRYEDVTAALKDGRLAPWTPFAADGDGAPHGPRKLSELRARNIRAFGRMLLQSSPPAHTRMRKALNATFATARIAAVLPRIQAIADELIDRVDTAGAMDVTADYALRLPIRAACEMLGMPPEQGERLRPWSADLRSLIIQEATPEREERGLVGLWALREQCGRLMRDRRAKPRDDFISDLIAQQARTDLGDDELLANVVLPLLITSPEIEHFIAGAALALRDHPAELRMLKDDPASMPTAIEELLRFVTPGLFVKRQAKETLEVGDRRIEKGQTVVLSLRAANRDPHVFPRPDELDLHRSPNPHLAFGGGIHHCLGAYFVRLEGQIALATLVRRVDHHSWRVV